MSNFTNFKTLDEIEEEYDCSFDESDKTKDREQLILSIFNKKIKPNNKLFSESSDGYIEYMFGYYYHLTDEDDDRMIKYYKDAVKKNNVIAMYELGHHYDEEEDYEN